MSVLFVWELDVPVFLLSDYAASFTSVLVLHIEITVLVNIMCYFYLQWISIK